MACNLLISNVEDREARLLGTEKRKTNAWNPIELVRIAGKGEADAEEVCYPL